MDAERLKYIMDIDRDKKTKYILCTKGEHLYSFVTTKLNEEESIKILKERANCIARKSSLHYYIYKIKNKEKTLIGEGQVKPLI
jgi:hypothetical protein